MRQFNVRLPETTIDRIKQLSKIYGSQAKVVIAAIENLHTKDIEMIGKQSPQCCNDLGQEQQNQIIH